jgi:hypothetical protein
MEQAVRPNSLKLKIKEKNMKIKERLVKLILLLSIPKTTVWETLQYRQRAASVAFQVGEESALRQVIRRKTISPSCVAAAAIGFTTPATLTTISLISALICCGKKSISVPYEL